MEVDLQEFREAYLAEMDEHLAAINQALLGVEAAQRASRAAPRELRELMRLLHTVKGLSAMVGVEPLVGIAHRMENVLRAADRAGGRLSERALEAMISGAREIESRVRAVARNESISEVSAAMHGELDALAEQEPLSVPLGSALDPELAERLTASEREQIRQGVGTGRRAVRLEFAPSPAKAGRGLTITTVRERLARLGEIVRVLPTATVPSAEAPGGLVFTIVFLTDAADAAIVGATEVPASDLRELVSATPLPIPAVDPGAALDDDVHRPAVLRVEVARIDDTIDKLAELIVTRSRLARAVGKLRDEGVDTRDLEAILADNARQLRDLRAAILRARMVPIAAVLDRLPLVIRGLGRATGKQVRLVVIGGEAELDKTVAERIFPALVHILRNAVDHGIESPEERQRLGKPADATITVTASTSNSRRIDLLVEDDGRGIDREVVAAKAGKPVPSDDAGLLDLLCATGFSTRDAVDTTSGRGVGMDIVRTVVEGLGGELGLASTLGRGTSFSIGVPLTIAIVDAFILRCGDERFLVPVPIVEEIVDLDPARIVTGPRAATHDGRFFARRGEAVALVDLAVVLADRGEPAEVARASRQALVVRRGREEPIAFAIDRVLGQQEIVVRPLVDPLVSVRGVSGTADLGDGRATLVLDLMALGGRRGWTRAA